MLTNLLYAVLSIADSIVLVVWGLLDLRKFRPSDPTTQVYRRDGLFLVVLGVCGFGVWGIGHYRERSLEAATAQSTQRAAEAEQKAERFRLDIATANQRAAEANEKTEKEKVARLELERQIASRHLTGGQKTTLVKRLDVKSFLEQPATISIVIVSAWEDGESSDFADDFDSAFKAAGWHTARYANRLTRSRGISVGTVAGTQIQNWIRDFPKLISDALTATGIQNQQVSFSADDAHSTSPGMVVGVLYLVIDHKPEVRIGK